MPDPCDCFVATRSGERRFTFDSQTSHQADRPTRLTGYSLGKPPFFVPAAVTPPAPCWHQFRKLRPARPAGIVGFEAQTRLCTLSGVNPAPRRGCSSLFLDRRDTFYRSRPDPSSFLWGTNRGYHESRGPSTCGWVWMTVDKAPAPATPTKKMWTRKSCPSSRRPGVGEDFLSCTTIDARIDARR